MWKILALSTLLLLSCAAPKKVRMTAHDYIMFGICEHIGIAAVSAPDYLKMEARLAEDLISLEMKKKKWNVIERRNIASILEEYEIVQSGLTDQGEYLVPEPGAMRNIDCIMSGRLTGQKINAKNESISLVLRLFSVRQGYVYWTGEAIVEGKNRDKMVRAAVSKAFEGLRKYVYDGEYYDE